VFLGYLKQDGSFRQTLPSGVCSRKYKKAYFVAWNLLIEICLSCNVNIFIVFKFIALMFGQSVISKIPLGAPRGYKM
jgi:hypothetical protein